MNRPPELRICLDDDEICIDNFAGGGGASTGMDMVLERYGRHVDIAINHNAEAISLHRANHPHTEHYVTDVFHIDIVKACRGRRVGFAWYSPDCTFHSKARGGKPFRDRNKARRIRGLAWCIIKQAKQLRDSGAGLPRIISMENVQEFADWGPLDDDGKIIQIKKGFTFRRWCRQLANLGYELDMWQLQGCDYGAPTTRERLFIVARRDGLPIVKPQPTHGPGRPKPYRTAADCIDFSLPCPSIFSRKRPLAENTLKRIYEGIKRYVQNGDPFIVPVSHSGDSRVHGTDEPLRTITASRRGDFAIVQPFIATVIARLGQTGGGGKYVNGVQEPLTTVTTKGEHMVVAPLLVPRYGEREGQRPRARSVQLPLPTIVTTDNSGGLVAAYLAKQNGVGEKIVKGQALGEPMHTITTKDQKAVVTSHLLKFKGTSEAGQPVTEPLHTVQAQGTHYAEVRAFLIKYYSEGGQWGSLKEPVDTITTKDRIGLVTVAGEDYVIVDIGLRMLTPRELYRAQGFPDRAIRYTVRPCLAPPNGNSANAGHAESPSARPSASARNKRAVVAARIDCGRKVLVLRSRKKLFSSAGGAVSRVTFPLPIGIVASARSLARDPSSRGQTLQATRAASPGPQPFSTTEQDGRSFASASGDEITLRVVDAASGTSQDIGLTKSTTSPAGPSFHGCGSPLEILCSFVGNAIASSIPSEISAENSCAFDLEINDAYLIDIKVGQKPLTKTAQVRMCGNSVCPPVAAAVMEAQLTVERAEEAVA